MRNVSREENKRKEKKCLGVLSVTDPHVDGDVGRTNHCSNHTQISEFISNGETAGTASKRVQ